MTAIVFGTVLPWLLIGVGTWLGFQLVRQNGRLLLRLETIEKQLAPRAGAKPREAGGLPIGMAAPDFELPDLTGVRHKLSDFRDRNVLLIFFNPQCGYCTKMAPDLAALRRKEAATGLYRSWSPPAMPRRTGSSSSSMAYGAWSCGRKRWKSPRSSAPRERPWDIGSTRRVASPAN